MSWAVGGSIQCVATDYPRLKEKQEQDTRDGSGANMSIRMRHVLLIPLPLVLTGSITDGRISSA